VCLAHPRPGTAYRPGVPQLDGTALCRRIASHVCCAVVTCCRRPCASACPWCLGDAIGSLLTDHYALPPPTPFLQALVLAGADPRGVLAAIEAQMHAAPELQ